MRRWAIDISNQPIAMLNLKQPLAAPEIRYRMAAASSDHLRRVPGIPPGPRALVNSTVHSLQIKAHSPDSVTGLRS
jgi:hypothetical protein